MGLKAWLGSLSGRFVATAIGVLLTLGGWTVKSRLFGGDRPALSDRIPAGVWEADGPTIELEIETNAHAQVSASFSREDGETGARQLVGPGRHSFRIRVPRRAAFSIFELGIDDPSLGAVMAWTIRRDGALISREHARLDAPLRAGYAFCITFDSEDLAAEPALEEK